MSLRYNADNSYLFTNGKEIYKFKTSNKNGIFPSRFCLGSISNAFDSNYLNKVSLKGNVCDFSGNYAAIDKSNVLSLNNYLMIKDSI